MLVTVFSRVDAERLLSFLTILYIMLVDLLTSNIEHLNMASTVELICEKRGRLHETKKQGGTSIALTSVIWNLAMHKSCARTLNAEKHFKSEREKFLQIRNWDTTPIAHENAIVKTHT